MLVDSIVKKITTKLYTSFIDGEGVAPENITPRRWGKNEYYRKRGTIMTTNKESRGYCGMNIPAITGIENALKIYYTYSELGNRQITELFGKRSSATISRLKRAVKNEMAKREVLSYGMNKVNTSIAYDVWGIDVADLERRMKKLKNLDL